MCSYTKSLRIKKKEKENTKTYPLRKLLYYEWALEITKIQQEDTFKHYNYLEEVLNYIHAQVPKDVKGEILEDWYRVSVKELCEALQNKLL